MASKKVRLRRLAGGLRMHSRDHLIRLRESKLKPMGVSDCRSLMAVPVLLGLIVLIGWLRLPDVTKVTFWPTEEAYQTPLAGWAVRADSWGTDDRLDTSLVYAEVTWAELEPAYGVYDFESFEAKNHLDQWWAEGKRLILRFVIDRPGETGHKDIPEWLVEAMGGEELAGDYYEVSAGAGFAPDYSSLIMRKAHRQAISAIAERYDGHPGVAYIEIGSLGWNGEWTVDLAEGAAALPASTISREYAWHYTSAFDSTLMLMRRPYKETQLLSVGLYNARLGDFEATWDYLDVIESGGYDRQIETDLMAMQGFYNLSPSGAHIPEKIDLEALLEGKGDELARQIVESHLSYAVLDGGTSGLSDEAIEKLQELDVLIGYRIWLRSAEWDSSLRAGMRSKVWLQFRNDGIAPLHAGWPVALALFDGDQMLCAQTTEADSAAILPGESRFMAWIDVPDGTDVGVYTLKMAILDPADGQPGVRLSMAECDGTLWTELGELRVIG